MREERKTYTIVCCYYIIVMTVWHEDVVVLVYRYVVFRRARVVVRARAKRMMTTGARRGAEDVKINKSLHNFFVYDRGALRRFTRRDYLTLDTAYHIIVVRLIRVTCTIYKKKKNTN